MMPKSSAMYLPWLRRSMATKMLPGCMSAWKKPSRNTCVKKISTPARDRRFRSMPASTSSSTCDRSGCPPSAPSPSLRACTSPSAPRAPAAAASLEIAAQLRAVGRLAHQVELVVDRLLELGDHLARPQAPAVRPQLLHRASRRRTSAPMSLLDHAGDVRPQHLDRDRRAVVQRRRNAPARPTRSPPACGRTPGTPASTGLP